MKSEVVGTKVDGGVAEAIGWSTAFVASGSGAGRVQQKRRKLAALAAAFFGVAQVSKFLALTLAQSQRTHRKSFIKIMPHSLWWQEQLRIITIIATIATTGTTATTVAAATITPTIDNIKKQQQQQNRVNRSSIFCQRQKVM
ncbi:unnamed protein product [Ceratitis capitata]|uniref:(Mediterranean fruit fly) hypothetical protein n=1 Tax=Ceratitis capitata TaxID=7213 RepID=A0A811TZP3_CERCA|nr:unnamed protein product [Ceratitis capitata]